VRWRGCEVAPPHLHSVSERLIVEARVAVLWRQPLNRERAHSVGLEHFALDHDPGNSYAIEDVLGKPYAILFAEHKINLSSLIPNKQQRTSGRNAQLRAEGMIVGMHVAAKVAICIGDFATQVHGPSGLGLSDKQIDVPSLGQSLRFCHIQDQGLHFSKWHPVQFIPISELESAQSQSHDSAEQGYYRLSSSMLWSNHGLDRFARAAGYGHPCSGCARWSSNHHR
jgi:hypothetical protein